MAPSTTFCARTDRRQYLYNRSRAKLLCVVKGVFGGAGRPVMGHSGKGELLSGQAVPNVFGVTGRQFVHRTAGGVGAFVGQARHS